VIAAFFHDERFTRDAAGVYRSSSGAIPYRALARYLRHFERVVVVGRLVPGGVGTVAGGDGVAWACLDLAALSPARWLPAVTGRVREVLAEADCAVVRLPGLIGPVACREALRRGVPLLVEVVGDAFDALWNHGSLVGKLAAVPLALLNRHYVGRAPFATYVTRHALQRRYPAGGEAAAVSDVIIESPRDDVLARRLAAIARRDPRSPAVLGLVGSYDVGYKGHETALRALARLRREGRDVRLRCIGVGDASRWRARAAALGVEEAVELGGPLPAGEAVLRWMDALDLYCIPSLQEGLPRALVEAMSRGLPAVGSRRGGIPELLGPEALHRPGDDRGLAGAVARLLDRPEELRSSALASWHAAASYAASELDARRDAFIARFAAAVADSAGRRRAQGGALAR
jgi:glycosyltransferase involved in cell wall biosynthesis